MGEEDIMMDLFTDAGVEVEDYPLDSYMQIKYDMDQPGQSTNVKGLIIAHSTWNNQFRIDNAHKRIADYNRRLAEAREEGDTERIECIEYLMGLDPRQHIEEYQEEPQLELYTGGVNPMPTKIWRSRIRKARSLTGPEIVEFQSRAQGMVDTWVWRQEEYDKRFAHMAELEWRPTFTNLGKQCPHEHTFIIRYSNETKCRQCAACWHKEKDDGN